MTSISPTFRTFFLPTDQAGRVPAWGVFTGLDAAPQIGDPGTGPFVADVAQFTPNR